MKKFKEFNLNPKLIIVSLWIAMLFVFAYVDIFGFFRADVLQNALMGKVHLFEVNQLFLVLTSLFIIIPTLMIPLTLMSKSKISRWLNIIIPAIYILMIGGSMVGESWIYYLLGSIIEIILLIMIIWYAWKWPRLEKSELPLN